MARILIEPPGPFHFLTRLPVRITDLNYGGHVGNDALLGLLQEARLQYLGQWGYTELQVAGVGLIMSDASIVFKGESFYGDVWEVRMLVAGFSRVSFDWYYAVDVGGRWIALARTGMVCFDYTAKRPVPVPALFTGQVAALSAL